ncbi:MAG: hypothetical protein NBV67_19255 [Tagaea sp.]|nr:hypothetical protein [Tagaea sp.]
MNREWMAVVGLVAVGAAAAIYFSDRPADRLRTITGPLSTRECVAWREQAERFERRQPGWFAVYEGFAHLQGVCLPKAPDRGRALIEGAFAARLDEMLVIPYYEALVTTGDFTRADGLALLAVAANQLHLSRTNAFYSQRDVLMLSALDPRTRVGTAPGEWEIWYQRVRTMLDRPPNLPDVESAFLNATITDLARIRATEAYLLLDEAQRSGRIRDVPLRYCDTAISLAASCGNTEALRRQARYFVAGELNHPNAFGMVGRIAWLHSRTNAEAESLAVILERAQISPDNPVVDREASAFHEALRRRCPHLNLPAHESPTR